MTAEPFQPNLIEAAVQAAWNAGDVYRVTERDDRRKFYCVSMLPYPSGKLHMGHVRNYTINDVMYRHLRMKGLNVLMPMGWDAFGLPAENAAMKGGLPPAQWTYENIAYMKKQMQAMGLAIDWSREVATCQPSYYKWNQWLFLKMLEKGIAYQKTGMVNWDPVDQTVLANEQVIDGRGWRSGAVIEKREIPMYYLRITDYADELLSKLDDMPGWPERVKTMQANWIGKSFGVRFAFTHEIKNASGALIGDGRMYVFTTRADTIMGVTFCAVAAEHPLAAAAARGNPALATFIDECKRGSVMEADMATMEKKGMPTGLFVTHPLTDEQVPVWVGNYVLMSYGDGAVMGVPAHDERDFEFASKYGLQIRPVIVPESFEGAILQPKVDTVLMSNGCEIEKKEDVPEVWSDSGKCLSWKVWDSRFAEYGKCINSLRYDGKSFYDAVDAVVADLSARGLGEKQATYRLRDWGISRQRYWGTPIPIIHCPTCGAVPVPEKDLPVVLPEDCVPDGSGNPLNKRDDFLKCACPKCGGVARRETDTMDTFVDSCWYYMRYTCPDAPTMVDACNDYWMPMDQYIGGIEHAILHLLYARFWTKVMRDLGLVKVDEPFERLLTQGMVLNHIFQRRTDKGGIDYYAPEEIEVERDSVGKIIGARAKDDGASVEYVGIGTMSKSKRNGVDPQELIDRYGADTARLFVMFASHPEATLEWSDAGVEGAHRFLRRLWLYASEHRMGEVATNIDWRTQSKVTRQLCFDIHSTLKQANFDYERLQYNTVVSAGMKMLNALEAFDGQGEAGRAAIREGLSIVLRILYPIVPHITYRLWEDLGYGKVCGTLLDALWPEVDDEALMQDEIELVLQVNGKLRGKLMAPADATREALEILARDSAEVAKHAEGRAIKKIVVVSGRLINVVV